MTQQQCNAHLFGFNLMANSTTTKEEFIENDKLITQYIKTFDTADDPIVYTLVRTSPYTYDDMLRDGFSAPEHHFDSLQTIRFDRWTYPHVRKATLPPCLQGATIKKTY